MDIFAPCMLSNPCRYLDESKSMRLQLTHILSNLYITKSLHNGGWRQGSTKPLKHILWQTSYWPSWLSFWTHKCSSLQKLTHVGRCIQIPSGAPNSWWATSTLSNPHKFNYMITRAHPSHLLPPVTFPWPFVNYCWAKTPRLLSRQPWQHLFPPSIFISYLSLST